MGHYSHFCDWKYTSGRLGSSVRHGGIIEKMHRLTWMRLTPSRVVNDDWCQLEVATMNE